MLRRTVNKQIHQDRRRAAPRRFEAPEIVISADLGAGDAATTVWTCDLTHEYISINGDYRS